MASFLRHRSHRFAGLALVAFFCLVLAGPAGAAANGRIAFVSNRDGDNEIYSMGPDGSGIVQLTSDTADEGHPSWSPDGTRIAFDSNRTGQSELWVMNADGSGQTQLTFDSEPATDPTWSPDGATLAFVKDLGFGTGSQEIFEVSSAGGPETRVTNDIASDFNPTVDEDPAWSPDGTRIAFASDRRSGNVDQAPTDIYTLPTSSGSIVNVTQTPNEAELAPDWSPDAGRIVFARSSTPGQFDIWTVSPAGLGQALLIATPADETAPTWSPDGTRVAFASNADGDYDIYAAAPDGTGLTQLTDDAAADQAPDWGPAAGPGSGDGGTGGSDGGGDGGITTLDRDGDGIDNFADNCPDLRNPSQTDIDSDRIGDLCDDSNGALTPVMGESVVVRVVSGKVFIQYPRGKRATPFTGAIAAAHSTQVQPGAQPGFVPLKGASTVPLGSTIDTEEGRVSLTSAADAAGATQSADFYSGVFTVTQAKAKLPITELRLRGLPYRLSCGAVESRAAHAASRRKLGKLWGSGIGRFRTRGRFSAATVRGTKWLTVERCDGTLTQVAKGKVSVFVRATGRRLLLKAGRAYLAQATAKARRKVGLF